jgi:hypothetical protein
MAAAAAWAARLTVTPGHPALRALLLLGVFSAVFLALAWWLGMPEVRNLRDRLFPTGGNR